MIFSSDLAMEIATDSRVSLKSQQTIVAPDRYDLGPQILDLFQASFTQNSEAPVILPIPRLLVCGINSVMFSNIICSRCFQAQNDMSNSTKDIRDTIMCLRRGHSVRITDNRTLGQMVVGGEAPTIRNRKSR
jgi:hypothetical protein